jgi:hypothetical protein
MVAFLGGAKRQNYPAMSFCETDSQSLAATHVVDAVDPRGLAFRRLAVVSPAVIVAILALFAVMWQMVGINLHKGIAGQDRDSDDQRGREFHVETSGSTRSGVERNECLCIKE